MIVTLFLLYVISVHTTGAVEGEEDNAAHLLLLSKPYNVTFIIRIDGNPANVSTVIDRIPCEMIIFNFPKQQCISDFLTFFCCYIVIEYELNRIIT
jgi:hypothetical protein